MRVVVLGFEGCVARIPLRAAEANEGEVGVGVKVRVEDGFHFEASEPAGLFTATVLGAVAGGTLRVSSSLIRR